MKFVLPFHNPRFTLIISDSSLPVVTGKFASTTLHISYFITYCHMLISHVYTALTEMLIHRYAMHLCFVFTQIVNVSYTFVLEKYSNFTFPNFTVSHKN